VRIVNKRLEKTADISSAKHTGMRELGKLTLIVTVLMLVLYIIVGIVVDIGVSHISYETEASIFSNFKVNSVLPVEPNDVNVFQRAQGVLRDLIADPQVPPLDYRLVLVRDSKPNAFAFPGGCIGITEGLVRQIQDDDACLAFVLGHELGHFKNRDHLRGLGRTIGLSAVYMILFGGNIGTRDFGNVFNYVLTRRYSRHRETRADIFAMGLLYRHYGKKDGPQRLFDILKRQDKLPGWAYMFAAHPSPEERVKTLEDFANSFSDMQMPIGQ